MLLVLATSLTAPNAFPVNAGSGKPALYGAPGQGFQQGFRDANDTLKAYVWSVAGSGTMTATVEIWGFHPDIAKWFQIRKLNGGVAIPEQDADRIAYSEDVPGCLVFTRYAAVLTAIAGTLTEVSIALGAKLT